MAAEFDLEFTAGDDEDYVFYFWTDRHQTVPLDLTGRTYSAQVRTKRGNTSVSPSAELGITVLDNTVMVSATAEQTRALRDNGRRYYWDLEQVYGGKRSTLFTGGVTVSDDVTR